MKKTCQVEFLNAVTSLLLAVVVVDDVVPRLSICPGSNGIIETYIGEL